MSTHSLPKIDQKEYLKKYLSGDKTKKKKKDRKRKKSSAASVKVIDDDINYLNTGPEIDEELLLTGDDAPQIVGEYIQESSDDKKIPKWKSIVIKDEPDDERDTRESETNLWGRTSHEVRVKQEFTMGEVRSKRVSNYSPHRRNRKQESPDTSPPRKSRKTSNAAKYKRDKSPLKYKTNRQSPDRRTKIKTEPISPAHGSNEICISRRNSDQSPPRRRKSPFRSSRYESPADRSPIRRSKMSDQSPPRRSRRNSDQSPPRRHKNACNDSPHRKNRRKTEMPDNSPPRKSNKTTDESPPRRKHNLEESIPSKSGNYNSNYRKLTSDQSPPRKIHNFEESTSNKNNSRNRTPDQSPRRKRKSSPSSHRRREKLTPELSPPPRRSRWEKQELDEELSPPPTHKPKPGKTLEGKKSGLQDAKALQKESMERRKQDDILFETMSSDISGRNAEIQVRATGRRGRRARAADEEDSEERRRKEDREEKKKLLYDRWGKGLKQIEDHKNRMLEQQYESSKPLARYSNDEDLERHLKEQERAEDPMLDYMRKKRQEKEKQSGKPQIPRYEGAYPENRFGIRPGYRWDGVDRSNGYEKKYFAVQSEKVARQDEAYKYSVEDM